MPPSNLQPCAGDEVGGLEKLKLCAPKFSRKRCPVRPQLYSEVLVEGAVLQYMLWGVGACLTRAVRGVRQPQTIQVGAQTAVSSAQPKDHNLLVALEMVDCVTWIVVSQLFRAASHFTLDKRLSLSVDR